MRRLYILCLLAFAYAPLAHAGVVSLLGNSAIGERRGQLMRHDPKPAPKASASLFVGRSEGSLFSDPPAHVPVYALATGKGLKGRDVTLIRDLIGQAESRHKGYDAVQHGARVKPGKRPTEMTLAEVFDWIARTPGQPHAIGRYQFIPATLARVVRKTGIGPKERFSPAVQDRLADVLLAEAGLQQFRAGKLSRTGFMNNLAKIWAGLPNSSGKSHYDGYAGNKASMTWARFDAAMASISP